jgi:hypothetical protein
MSAGIKANVDGSGAIQVGGSDYITISAVGAVAIPQTLAVTGAATAASLQVGGVATNLYPLVSGTAVASTSGTSIEFINIPSTAKRITVMFRGVSTNGTGALQVQLGTGVTPTYTITGYSGSGANVGNGVSPAVVLFSTGFGLMQSSSAASTYNGNVFITNLSGDNWVENGVLARGDSASVQWSGGSIALAAALTSIRVIGSATGSPSDTFDAGTINIMWE